MLYTLDPWLKKKPSSRDCINDWPRVNWARENGGSSTHKRFTHVLISKSLSELSLRFVPLLHLADDDLSRSLYAFRHVIKVRAILAHMLDMSSSTCEEVGPPLSCRHVERVDPAPKRLLIEVPGGQVLANIKVHDKQLSTRSCGIPPLHLL